MKAAMLKAIFVIGIIAAMAMALRPNRHGGIHNFVPASFRAWVNEHDDFQNIAAFFLIATVALLLPGVRNREGKSLPAVVLRTLEPPLARVAALMLFVCVIELVQRFIPGRVPDLQDVCTGWSGIFAAWLVWVLRRAGR